MPPRSRGIALPTIPQVVVFSLVCFGCWLGWGEFASFQERQGLWNPEATATERLRAADAWSEQGEEAVPELIRALSAPHAQTRRYAAVALAQLETRGRGAILQLRERLGDPHPLVRAQSAATLPAVDPHSSESIEAVADMLSDPDRNVRLEAATALRTWGPRAAPAIVARLKHPLPEVRQIAIDLIPRTPAARHAVLPTIRELAADPSDPVREAAIHVLIESGNVSLPELVEWLIPDNDRICSAAILALRRFDSDAAVAVPQLIRCLEHSQPRNQLLAIDALRAIGPAAQDSVPALLSRIDRASERTILAPLQAIESIGGTAEMLAAPLDALSEHSNPAVAGTALRMLHKYDRDRARARIDRLNSVLGGSGPYQIRTACSTIVHLGVLAEETLPNLQFQLESGDRQIRHFVLLAIRSIGPAAAPIVPSIVSLLDESANDPALFDALVETVIALGPSARSAADAIVTHLNLSLRHSDDLSHASIHRQARLIVAAARIGVTTPEFRESLRAFLDSGRPMIQIAALDALAMLGNSDAPERAMILDSLDADDPATRMAAIHAIPTAIGPEPVAADAIAECLTDPEPRVRVAAAQALGRMGGSAGAALPALRTASHDSANESAVLRFVPMSFGPPHHRTEPRQEDHVSPGATVSDVMQQAIREIESTSATYSH